MASVQQPRQVEHTLGIRELLETLRRGKWIIIVIAALSTLAGGLIGYRIPPSYTSATLLAAVTESSSGGQSGVLSSMASQLGGLASLAGMSTADSRKAESVAVLQSEFLTERYIRDNDLLPVLFKKRWDANKLAWKVKDPSLVPTLWSANQFFKKSVRSVATDSKTGLITLTITWTDPRIAAKWANDLVALTNDYLRTKSIAESKASIDFLTEEAAKTTDVEARQAVFRVLESEVTKAMFAKGNKEFAFKILDPAFAPERPSSLPRYAWWVLGFLVGVLLSLPIVLVRARLPLWFAKPA